VASSLERDWAGGVGRVVAGLARALAEQGHEVHLAGRARDGQPGPLPGVTLHTLPPRRLKLAQLPPLRRLLGRLRPQVLHFHSAVPHGAVIVPLLALRGGARVPRVVVTPYTGARADYAKRLARLALQRADAVVANSRWGAERAVRAGAAGARVHVIPAGVDAVAPGDPAARGPLVVALARLVHSKGLGVLLDAFARAADARPGWALRVAGTGREADALRAQAGRLACGERITFLGPTGGDAKAALLAEASIGVVPSRRDNQPGALLELQAHGIACVASAVGGIPDLLAGDAGVPVPPDDVEALARALGGLMDDASRRERLGRAAAAAGRARSFEAVAGRHVALYAALLRTTR